MLDFKFYNFQLVSLTSVKLRFIGHANNSIENQQFWWNLSSMKQATKNLFHRNFLKPKFYLVKFQILKKPLNFRFYTKSLFLLKLLM